jgi:hypothetical protein
LLAKKTLMATIIQRATQAAACSLLLLVIATGAHAQGTFQNLDFESANVSGAPQSVPVGTALPGWTAFAYTTNIGTVVLPTVWYNGISLGGAGISLVDSNNIGFSPLQGKYSVKLFGGGTIGALTSVGISQSGLVPAGSRTLLVDVLLSWGPPFGVTLGGETVNMVAQQTFPGYTRYAGDITSLAGQVATLIISEPPALTAWSQPSAIELDNIQFSPVPIPEPGLLGLFALGALLVGTRHLNRRRPTSLANQSRQPTPGVHLAAQRTFFARHGCALRWAFGICHEEIC